MEQPRAISSFSMQNPVFDMTSSSSSPGTDRKHHPPFQSIIEKGRQAKAQVEQDQYEARKAKRESDIKNAARIRHAEAEANRRREEESKMSIDEHKSKLLDEMTTNIKAMLENQYRKEIRAKIYENEDRIAFAHEQDIKDQTKAKLVKELESVVKAKLEAELEPEIKQRLAVELVSVVKTELRAKHETEVRQQLVKDLGPMVELELRVKYETDVKQQLAEELQPGIQAELRAQYGKELQNQLMNDPKSTVIHDQKGTQTDDVQAELQGPRNDLHTPEEKLSRATPNDINTNGLKYPDLSHHHHLINQNVVQNGQQEAGFVQELQSTITDGDAAIMPRGTKRSLSGLDNEEEDSYARQSKRSRNASPMYEEQKLPSRNEEEGSKSYTSDSHIPVPHQGAQNNSEDIQGLSQYKGDDGYDVTQGSNGYSMDRGTSGYKSSNEVQARHENILGCGEVDCYSAEDAQGMNGNLLNREMIDDDSVEDVQETNGDLSHLEEAAGDSEEDVQEMNGALLDHEGADYDSAEDMERTNGNFLSREEANHDRVETFQGSYTSKLKATESYISEEEDAESDEEEDDEFEEEFEEDGYAEEYGSEEEEQYSTAPQAAAYSNVGNGVISFSNTQDTAFILSDSEDESEKEGDEDKTLIGYDGPGALAEAKHYDMPAEDTFP